jgi:hypothetical protein
MTYLGYNTTTAWYYIHVVVFLPRGKVALWNRTAEVRRRRLTAEVVGAIPGDQRT